MKIHLKIIVSLSVASTMLGCHSTPKRQPTYFALPTSSQNVSANDAIWVPAQFSAYSVGRYVDPNEPNVMHDAHTLYRQEQTGRWNLSPAEAQAASSISSSVHQPDGVLLHDALTAELNRQRVASLALVQQAKVLDAHLRELNSRSQEFHDSLQQFYQLRDQMTLVSNRLDSIEYQLRALPPSGKSP